MTKQQIPPTSLGLLVPGTNYKTQFSIRAAESMIPHFPNLFKHLIIHSFYYLNATFLTMYGLKVVHN